MCRIIFFCWVIVIFFAGVMIIFLPSYSTYAMQVSQPPVVQPLLQSIVAIDAGEYHTCALTVNGGVKCWGENLHWELGDGTTNERNIPSDVNGFISGGTVLGMGRDHSCVAMARGGVRCWGSADLGYNYYNDHPDQHPARTPSAVQNLTNTVVGIAAGALHTCVLTDKGGVKCWGLNAKGVLGNGMVGDYTHVPIDVTGLTNGIRSITAYN